MRYSHILVPIVITCSVFVIVGAEAGWFEGTGQEPVFIRAIPGSSATRPAPVDDATPETGRSVQTAASAADHTDASTENTAPTPASDGDDPLTQARAEAAKARQDVVDVTRASIEAQAAVDTEAQRQKSEADDAIAQLQAKVEAQAKEREAGSEATRRIQSDLGAAKDETAMLKRQLASQAAAAQAGAQAMAANASASKDTSKGDTSKGDISNGATAAPNASQVVDSHAEARLRDDLDGARRGEATLREENAVLQRELVEARQAAAASDPLSGRSVADGQSAAELSVTLRKVRAEVDKLRAALAHGAAAFGRLRGPESPHGRSASQGVHVVTVPADVPFEERPPGAIEPFRGEAYSVRPDIDMARPKAARAGGGIRRHPRPRASESDMTRLFGQEPAVAGPR